MGAALQRQNRYVSASWREETGHQIALIGSPHEVNDMHQERQLSTPCEQTISILLATMPVHGIRLERSFDLRSALHDHGDCPCPHHGNTLCTCQFVVLLAYEPATIAPPAVITAHECDGITRVRLAAGEPGGALSWPLLAALDEALTNATADI